MPDPTDGREYASQWEQIEQRALAAIDKAVRFADNYSFRRMKSWDRYYGRRLGNEKKGRSKAITRDVMDCIEWMMPYFMRKFSPTEHWVKIKIQGQPDHVGEAVFKKIVQDQDEGAPNWFLLVYTWVKDSLVSGAAGTKPMWVYEEDKVEKTFEQPISVEQLQQLMEHPDVELLEQPEMVQGPDGAPAFVGVKVRGIKVKEDRFGADNVPHWELLLHEDSRSINDHYPKGHKTRVTVDYLRRIDQAMREADNEPYFRYLDQLETGAAGHTEGSSLVQTEEGTLEAERQSYKDFVHYEDQEPMDQGPGREVVLVEWYDRYDVDGDGFLEDITIWTANRKMIRWEINEDGFIPESIMSPIIDCYKIHGIGWAELLTEIQNIRTSIIRATLDSFAFQNQGRWRVTPGANVDTRALLRNAPNEIISADDGAIENLSPVPMDMRVPMGMLQIVDSMREERSGVTKLSQGHMDANTAMGLGQQGTPDRGIARLMSQAEKRMDMVARVFAETGFADLLKKAVWLMQRHLTEPFTVEIDGQEVQVAPEQIQGKVLVQPQLMVEQAVGMQQSQKAVQVRDFILATSQRYPALADPVKMHHLSSIFVEGMGFDASQFLPSLQEFTQRTKQISESQMQQQQAMQQMQQMQMRLEQIDKELEAKELQQEGALEARKQMLQERDSLRDHMRQLIELLQQGRLEQAKQSLEMAKTEYEGNVRQAEARERGAGATGANRSGGQGGNSPQRPSGQGLAGAPANR